MSEVSICHAYINVGPDSAQFFRELSEEQLDPEKAKQFYMFAGWYQGWQMAIKEYNVQNCIRGVGYYTFIFHSEDDLTKFLLRFSDYIESTRTNVDPGEDWQ